MFHSGPGDKNKPKIFFPTNGKMLRGQNFDDQKKKR